MVHTQYLGLPDGTLTMGTCAGFCERDAYARTLVRRCESYVSVPDIRREPIGRGSEDSETGLGRKRPNREGVSKAHPLRLPQGLFPILHGRKTREPMGRLDLPDPRRDEEEIIVLSTDFHQCSVLTENVWVCDECGETFPREQNGDYPEQAIIEGKCEP